MLLGGRPFPGRIVRSRRSQTKLLSSALAFVAPVVCGLAVLVALWRSCGGSAGIVPSIGRTSPSKQGDGARRRGELSRTNERERARKGSSPSEQDSGRDPGLIESFREPESTRRVEAIAGRLGGSVVWCETPEPTSAPHALLLGCRKDSADCYQVAPVVDSEVSLVVAESRAGRFVVGLPGHGWFRVVLDADRCIPESRMRSSVWVGGTVSRTESTSIPVRVETEDGQMVVPDAEGEFELEAFSETPFDLVLRLSDGSDCVLDSLTILEGDQTNVLLEVPEDLSDCQPTSAGRIARCEEREASRRWYWVWLAEISGADSPATEALGRLYEEQRRSCDRLRLQVGAGSEGQ